MENIVKIPSVQSSFTTTKNLVDIKIPSGGVWDLTQSYININMSVDTTDTVSTVKPAVYDTMIEFNDSNGLKTSYPNVSLIKHAHFSSNVKGNICDIRNLDVLKNTLDAYTKDRSDRADRSNYSLNSMNVNNQFGLSPFRELVCVNSTGADNTAIVSDNKVSRDIRRDIKIKLGDIFDICDSVDAYSGQVFGESNIHLEVNFDKLQEHTGLKAGDDYWDTDNGDGDSINMGAFDNVDNFTGDIINLTTSKVYKNPNLRSPFWEGQQLNLSLTKADDSVVAGVRQVKTIFHSPVDGKITIVLDTAIVVGATNDSYSGITCDGVSPATVVMSFNSVELVLQNAQANAKVPNGIEYTCYTTEIDSANNLTQFQRNYMVEPNAYNLFVCFPNQLVSKKDDFQSYRFSINNEVQTNRKIVDKKSLHYDNLQRVFKNAQLPLKSTDENIGEIGFDTDGITNNKVVLPCLPMPLTNSMKMIGVDLVAGTAMGQINFYKQVQRKI
tara:strand:- start:2086 stop:3576 length:1491 start_codon:yes stop_codon:yes gene_type:complete